MITIVKTILEKVFEKEAANRGGLFSICQLVIKNDGAPRTKYKNAQKSHCGNEIELSRGAIVRDQMAMRYREFGALLQLSSGIPLIEFEAHVKKKAESDE